MERTNASCFLGIFHVMFLMPPEEQGETEKLLQYQDTSILWYMCETGTANQTAAVFVSLF
jgi:hypothetical protein